MFSRTIVCCLFSIVVVSNLLADSAIDYNRDIRPLLSNHCFRCHGPDEDNREAGLRLDQFEAATQELDSGDVAVVPGLVAQSQLIARLRSDDEDLRMPPADLGPALDEAQIRLLETWIQQGAKFDRHWSLKPVRRPAIDTVMGSEHESPVDFFIDRRLAEHGITPNPRADRYAQIRRVSLALTGLPPTPAEVHSFVNDSAPEAYSRLVDRLLASPRYGEHWARVWLDIARYADSAGYAQDPARTIWRYRDWVIDAYNVNKPFDVFTIEQIAGDQLPSPSDEQLIATAFHRNTMTNSEGGTDDEEFRSAAIVDRVNTTMQVWMGQTMGCAQCHDHKYDDITQDEYYQVYGIFNNTADADRGDERPWLEELSQEQKTRRHTLQAQLDQLQKRDSTNDKNSETAEKKKQLEKQLRSIRGTRTPIMRELTGDARRDTFVHVRGNFRVKGDQVQPGVPDVFHELNGDPNRLSFAEWLVAEENPLTARVVVNRYWELVFGKGLVATSEDFGMQGDLPTHPELLDYLAAELLRHDWDTKWLLRTIVCSDAFRRSSKRTPVHQQLDPENQWWSRGPRFRLPAEMIRDQALHVSGLLSDKMLGPSVNPPRPKLGIRAAFGGSTDWQTSQGDDRYRRGLYTSWRRTTPYPSMTTFDAPSREFCTVRRIRTNTPLQALVTLNDPVFVEAAQGLARRVLSQAADWPTQVQTAFLLVLSRPARGDEVEQLRQLYDQITLTYRDDALAARQMAWEPLGETDQFDLTELASWTVLSNVLLNLDETLAPR